MPQVYKAIVLCSVLAFTQNVSAGGLLCTMPNGTTIAQRTSDCPRDAVRVVTTDGKVIRTQPLPPKWPPPPPKAPIPKAAQAPSPEPAKSKTREVVDEAYGLCGLLKAIGATTCDVKVNVFSASYIDATVATTPSDAKAACLKLVGITRQQPGSPFIGRGWELRMFSPMGSGTRPIAVCNL